MQPLIESDFVSLFIGSSVSPVALGSLQAGLVTVYGDQGYELGRQAMMGTGGIESADAARRSPRSPASKTMSSEAAFERVLEQYGFRGVNELREIAAPFWEIRPDVLRRAVDSVKAGGTTRDPDSTRQAARAKFAADGVREKFTELDLWLERCEVWIGVRERTKATCVLTINEMRTRRARNRSPTCRGRHAGLGRSRFTSSPSTSSAPLPAAAKSTSISSTLGGTSRPTCCAIRGRCSRSPARSPG